MYQCTSVVVRYYIYPRGASVKACAEPDGPLTRPALLRVQPDRAILDAL